MLPRFGYMKALAVGDAVTTLADYGREARLMAGGTDLLVGMTDGLVAPTYVVDIKHIPELRTIAVGQDGSLRLGACVTVNEILELRDLPAGMEALRQAAATLGTNQVRNRATVGGNLCNASPACDLAPPLLVLAASVRVVSPEGERTVALPDLFRCPKQTCLTDREILVEIVVPPARGVVSGFAKRQRIRGHDLAVVNAAVAIASDGKARVAVGAVAPTPLVIDVPAGEAGLKKVMDSISPIDDVRGSGAYRRSMVARLVTDLIGRLEQQRRDRRRA